MATPTYAVATGAHATPIAPEQSIPVQTRREKKVHYELFDQTVLEPLFCRIWTGVCSTQGGLWGRVSARCNRIGRGGHRAPCGTHVWSETQTPKSQVPGGEHVFLGGSTYNIALFIAERRG